MSKYIQEGDLILVEVPEGFYGYSIIQGYTETFLKISDRVGDYTTRIVPKSDYELIGKASELGEEDWRKVVESNREKGAEFNSELGHYQSSGWTTFYKNYLHNEPSICIPNTATESGLSLLKKHNLNSQTTIILKKKQ